VRTRVRHLTKGVAIYGAGDAAIQVVNLLLVAVYVQGGFLGAADYGALGLIIAVETFTKVVSRFGLDGSFMRMYHDRSADGTLGRLTSTLVYFLLAVNGVLSVAAILSAPWIGDRLFGASAYVPALQLMFLNTGLLSVTFVPFHLMRMRDQAVTYSGFVFARSVGTVILRILFVIGLSWGVTGMYLADVVVTLMLLPFLWPWFRALVGPVFSNVDLKAALRFGMPRVPHGLAQQALDAGNKLLLSRYLPLRDLGVYQNGVTFGTGIRFFTSAFETAWAPFYYATSREPDAKTTLSKMTTYGVAVLALLVAITIAVARDAVLVLLSAEWLDAARVIPFIAIGMAFQGVYLLTSIGLNLTGRSEYYPVSTFAALAVGLGLGVWLMPAHGVEGAAVAFMLSFAAQAVVAASLSQRVYPIPYETSRLLRLVAAGAIAAVAGVWAVPTLSPLTALLVRGGVVVAVYAALLWATGFMRPTERAFMKETLRVLRG
jgi:O-antigen/teichoic acid export membrane protein